MKKVLCIVLVAAAGLAAAVALGSSGASARSATWGIGNYPNGYSVQSISGDPSCVGGWIYRFNGTLIGCTQDSAFETNLNNYINSTICTVNPSADPTRCAPTTTTATTTVTFATTTTAPVDTTPTTTAAAPPPPPPVTTTVTVTTTIVDPTIDARIKALEDAYAALKTRVGNLEAATDAAWLAYRDALAGGATPQEAADIARGTALNLIYGLGVFAPIP